MIRLYGEVKQCTSLYFCIYSVIKRACVRVLAGVCVLCRESQKDTYKERWCEQERGSGFETLFETPNTLGSIAPYIVPCD